MQISINQSINITQSLLKTTISHDFYNIYSYFQLFLSEEWQGDT